MATSDITQRPNLDHVLAIAIQRFLQCPTDRGMVGECARDKVNTWEILEGCDLGRIASQNGHPGDAGRSDRVPG
jgi:hypothetical protein